jgi:hypothetical protein
MKAYVILALLYFLPFAVKGNSYSKIELRNAFILACIDQEKNSELINQLSLLPKNDPLIAAYTGALTAVKAKFSMNPWKKYSLCKEGMATLTKSITLSPNDIEIRYLRLLIAYKTPKIAGFQGDMINDKMKILSLIHSEQDSHLKKMIATFMLNNNICSESERKTLTSI